jgi:diguanylate cyclase (GGDEF)-like protein
MPLVADDRLRGVLALYAGETGSSRTRRRCASAELAGDIGFAIDHIEKEQRLRFLSYYDELTSLPNRTLFLDRTTQAIALAAQTGTRTAVVIGDIPRFRLINESLGRSGGDEVIRELGQRLKSLWPSAGGAGGILAHINADCFAGLVTDARGPRDIMRSVQAPIERALAAPIRAGSSDLRIAFAAGISVYPMTAATRENCFGKAEAALKSAKASGERFRFSSRR